MKRIRIVLKFGNSEYWNPCLSTEFIVIQCYPSNFHRYPSRIQQSLIWSACLFEICDREFQGDYGNLDNLPWNRPHMTSKIAPSVCLLADFPTIYSFISAQHRGWPPKQQPLWAWVTLNQKSVLMKKYGIHTSIDFVCQFEKDWSSWSNLHLSWKTNHQGQSFSCSPPGGPEVILDKSNHSQKPWRGTDWWCSSHRKHQWKFGIENDGNKTLQANEYLLF